VEGADVVDIGIPLEAEVCTGPGDLALLPARAPGAHKGAGGEVLVVGGGPYQGAPYIAAMGSAPRRCRYRADRLPRVHPHA